MEALLILFGIGYVLLGPVAFFLTLGARSRLQIAERKVKALEERLADVEAARVRTAPARPAGEDALGEEPVRETPWGQAGPELPPAEPAAGHPVSVEKAAEPPADENIPVLATVRPEEAELAGAATPLPGGTLPPEPPSGDVPPPVAPRPPSRPGFEERLGTRWAVWVGGLALAFGALLLVRHAFVQGWIGPGVRIVMGLLLALALTGAGEWLRRREKGEGDISQETDKFSFARPSIPAMLTAAGTIAAFGSVYAAHALYNFIGTSFAFIALGAIGVAAMFAAALHGPMLAGLGLVGSLATPLLVSSKTPSPWPVVVYLAVVAVAAFALARLRVWLWLALATALGYGLWTLIFIAEGTSSSGGDFYRAGLVNLVIQTAMVLYVFAFDPWRSTPENEAKIDPLTSFVALGFGVLACIAFISGNPNHFSTMWIGAGAAEVALFAIAGYLLLPAIISFGIAGVLTLGISLWWRSADNVTGLSLGRNFDDYTFLAPQSASAYTMFALIASAAIAGAGAWRVLRGAGLKLHYTIIYSAVSVLTPMAVLIVAYLRFTNAQTSTLFGSLALGIAAVFTLLAHIFRNGVREGEPATWNLALGIYASAAIAAVALAFVLVLDGGVLTVALSLAALGAAFVSVQLNIPALRWCVVGLGVAVAGRYMWEPRIVSDIGPRPIFNWLLFGYGVPALAFGYAARLMRRARGEDIPVHVGQALAIMCSALLVFFEIRHFINVGDAFATTSSLIEMGLFAIAAFTFAIVLMQLELRRTSRVMHYASLIFGVASVAISAIGLGLVQNPLFESRTHAVEGGLVFNGIMLGYLIPGLMALLTGRMADGARPRWYIMMMRVAAVLLLFAYLSLQVRRYFQGPQISLMRSTGDPEWYTYSVVWLAFGIALLAYGLWRRSVEVRLASAIFIVLSVLKVFVLDLSALEGVLRALSFIGLGLVLIGIGLVYQKFVFVRKAPLPPASPEVEGGAQGTNL